MSFREIASATRLRRLAVGVLVCGGAVGAASIDLASSPAAGAARGSLPAARAASTPEVKNVNQTMTMNVASIQGNTISAHGQVAHGQINGIVSFNLNLQNGSHLTASFTIFNNGHIGNEHRKGTVWGNASGHYHVSGTLSYFTGQVSGVHGSEGFSHAKNLGISLTGTLNRRTYKFVATLKGKVIE